MDPASLLAFAAGLALLLVGAELLVRGAARLAGGFGVSPLVVGLTVVAFGTSAPELAVSVRGAWTGEGTAIAVGNVVGSNVFNVLFILGLSALITPLSVAQQLVRVDVPLMIGASLLALLLALDGSFGAVDGAVLLAGLVGYTAMTICAGRRQGVGPPPASAPPPRPLRDLALVAVGLALLVCGAELLVDAALVMARALGLSELVIGATIVAAGTSLPEVATSVMASVRGQRDIAVGNVVGSNLFNLLGVLGASAVVAPTGLPVSPAALEFDLPVMAAVAFACLPVFFTGHRIARWEGAVFLAYYVAFTVLLVLRGGGSPLADPLASAMLGFVLPLTALTLGIGAWRQLRVGAPRPPPSR